MRTCMCQLVYCRVCRKFTHFFKPVGHQPPGCTMERRQNPHASVPSNKIFVQSWKQGPGSQTTRRLRDAPIRAQAAPNIRLCQGNAWPPACSCSSISILLFSSISTTTTLKHGSTFVYHRLWSSLSCRKDPGHHRRLTSTGQDAYIPGFGAISAMDGSQDTGSIPRRLSKEDLGRCSAATARLLHIG